MANLCNYSPEESEQVENLILELHDDAIKNNGKVSVILKDKLIKFMKSLNLPVQNLGNKKIMRKSASSFKKPPSRVGSMSVIEK